MAGIVVLRGTRPHGWAFPRGPVEVTEGLEALLQRLRAGPGALGWVAIAPDVDDPPAVARQVRRADPNVGVLLLGDGAGAVEDVGRILDALATGDRGATESEGAARRLLDAQRRAFEAEKLASIAELTAGLAHDVATPTTAILGYAELIAKSVGDDKNRKRANTIVQQVSRVRDLIETLMNLSRREDRPPIPVSLAGILDKSLDLCRERLERRGVEVLRSDGPAPRVLADPDRLHQVFLSLLLHASESMAGGGTLQIRLGEAETGGAEVRISHTGAGVDPSVQAQLPEAHLETRAHRVSRGLGLVVARALVEELGGTLALASEADRGAELLLTLPRLPVAP